MHRKQMIILLLTGVLSMGFSGSTVELLNTSGKITLLRVHDVGSKYGPASDQIDVETIVQLDSEPGKAFGFQMRPDDQRVAHEAMLNLLRDAFRNDWTVHMDYSITPGKKNGVILRVWITRK